MNENPELLSILSGLSRQYKAKENALKNSLFVLGERLSTICKECNTHYSGDNFQLACCSPDEQEYGHLWCDQSGLSLAYRSTMQDFNEEEPGVYSIKILSEWPINWIREVAQDKHIVPFVRGFIKHLEQLVKDTHLQTAIIDGLANNPSSFISQNYENLAKTVGYEKALEDWKDAQAAIAVSSDRAITLACVLLETICKHILIELGQNLPNDKSIVPLFKATAKALGLSPNDQAEVELRGLCGGLASVTQNIGVLRTKFGDAHGKDASWVSLSTSHALLTVNAAGATATFLMEQYMYRARK